MVRAPRVRPGNQDAPRPARGASRAPNRCPERRGGPARRFLRAARCAPRTVRAVWCAQRTARARGGRDPGRRARLWCAPRTMRVRGEASPAHHAGALRGYARGSQGDPHRSSPSAWRDGASPSRLVVQLTITSVGASWVSVPPLVVLLGEDRADHADHARTGREDPDDAGPVLGLPVRTLAHAGALGSPPHDRAKCAHRYE